MPTPGAVVLVDFPGVQGVKRRPAVVVSSDAYHAQRPDVIVALLTTNLKAATATTDYLLQDWQTAGLNQPSALRVYLAMVEQSVVGPAIGQLSANDWAEAQARLQIALSV